jgi:hypothetical protein
VRDKVIIYIDCSVQGFCKGGSGAFFFLGLTLVFCIHLSWRELVESRFRVKCFSFGYA